MASKRPQIRPSVRHPSHNHPLRGHKTKFEDEIICFGCNLDLIGASYKCTKSVCDYFLHKSCFELPREIHHKSHPNHALTLLHFPPYDHSTYKCNACGEYGSGFTYNCSICQYDVHVGCVSMAESMKHEDHEHPLDLVYSSLYRKDLIAICDVCHENIPHNLWSYFCQRCNYNTHLHSCIDEEKKEPFVADEDDEPRVADEEEESCVPNEEEHPCVIVENEQRCVTFEEEESCVVIEEEGSCIPYEEEQPCVAVEEEQRCIAIEEEEPCISDEKEEPCIAVEEEEPCVPDEEEQPCVAVEGEHPCVAVEEEQRCITVEEEQPCVAVEEEQQCIADEEEEPCVADEEEEPGNEGRIRKRDVIRVVANIASTVMGYGPLF